MPVVQRTLAKQEGTFCPVCLKPFRTATGRRSHQRQKNHYEISPPKPRVRTSPAPVYQLSTQALDEAAKAAKKRAKKERQRQRRQARYALIKEIILKMIEERGVEAVLGIKKGDDPPSTDPKQKGSPSSPSAPSVPVPPPDPEEIDRLLGDFINSLIDEDEDNSPGGSDSESTASDPTMGEEGTQSDADSESESESKSDTDTDTDTNANADTIPDGDTGGEIDDSFMFEPIINDGEPNQSSIYIRTEDSSMADQVSQLEMSLAELFVQDEEDEAPPESEIEVAEPVGEYSFLRDSPDDSDRTSTPPLRLLDESMADVNTTNGLNDEPVSYARSNQSGSTDLPVPVGRSELSEQSLRILDSSMGEVGVGDANTGDASVDDASAGDASASDTSSNLNSSRSGTESRPQWGAPIGQCLPILHRLHEEKRQLGLAPAHPFVDWLEFEFVKWMIERDISQGSREKLLQLPLIATRARLSFGSNYTLNKLLDKLPLAGPKWDVKAVKITGDKLGPDGKPLTEIVELWHRNILGVIRELLENHTYGKDLVFAPREEWNDVEKTERKYDEMWTGEWWRKLQMSGVLPPNATIIPVILASDATHLTNFGGGKQAYPVYITLGNIPKAIRRKPSSYGTLLLGYLPAQKLECFTKKGKTHQKERLFHQCMSEIVKPLETAGREGIELACGDGKIRKCFPILAAYTADNPEQTQVACCKKNLCYRCNVERDKRGDYAVFPDRHHVHSANALISKSRRRTTQYYIDNGLRPFGRPFWADLPHCNIYRAITPDLLHQLHKGVFKEHVMNWCLKLACVDETEFDDRFKAMPEHSNLRHFNKNVSELTQTTGKEHREMEKVFLGVMAGLVPNDVMPVLRALLDFIYYAQLPTHTDTTISWLEQALQQFHDSKDVFIKYGARTHFNINKLHSMMHYATAIRELGALDGYNTEGPERLHIDFAKRAYKATNRNDFISQMVKYLERREQVFKFDAYLMWAIPEYAESSKAKDEAWAAKREPGWHIAQKSPFKPVAQDRLDETFGIRWFSWAVGEFFERELNLDVEIDPNDKIAVYPKATQFLQDDLTFGEGFTDIVHASPHTSINRLSVVLRDSRFDTVLIKKPEARSEGDSYGLTSHTVGQVRMIFTLPEHYGIPDPLVCVYTFRSPTNALPVQLTGMHRVHRERYPLMYQNRPIEKVFFLSDIRRTCHLIPDFGQTRNPFWVSSPPALDLFDTFYINHYLDPHSHLFLQC